MISAADPDYANGARSDGRPVRDGLPSWGDAKPISPPDHEENRGGRKKEEKEEERRERDVASR